MLDGIMSLAGVPDKLQQFISLVMEAADKYQDAEKAAALEALDVTGREKAGEIVDDAAIVERLAREMTRCAYAVKPDGDIFPDGYRRAFTEEFLRENPAALPYKSDVEESVRRWFRELESVLRDNYSKEGRVILRYQILNRMDMGAIKRDLAEVLARLRSEQDPGAPATSNQDYKEIFEVPLFLHRGNSRVCLQNLFVPHRFKEELKAKMKLSDESMLVQFDWDEKRRESMDKYLARFIRDEKARFLFIEGDAGCGKSSLTAYLSWHYVQHDKTAANIFGDAQLITVRLRNIDIPISGKKGERLTLGVLRFLYGNKETDRDIMKRFRKSGSRVLLLDGYDELCTVDGIEEPEAVLRTLKNLDCKIIVTTRPNYIDFQYFEKPYWHIALEHFDGEQCREWLERYENCGETPKAVNRQYLMRISYRETAGICDTPMGLYMVAAGHFTADALLNEWAVYRQIFYRELSETEYNQIFQDVSAQHSIQEYQDLLYRVSEEIAWYLYQRNNENLLVPDSEITRIIGELELSEDKRKTVERCFALCGYWKANTGRGCVEFYHNNIRDFFLCEKLMRELNKAYREYGDALRDERSDITPFLRHLCELFQYAKLNNTVLFFIKQRAAYLNKEEPDLCVDMEREQHCTARIFETLLLRGDFYSICKECQKKENPVKTIARILGNTILFYRHIYEPLLVFGERVHWWRDIKKVNETGTFRQLSEQILDYSILSDLRGIYLRGVDLHGVDLCSVDLHNADLCDADLHSADLHSADLHWADLHGVNLHSADLHSADLHGADLHGVDLHGANLQGANLRDADLQRADLRDADLQRADLRNVDLQGANLWGTVLRGTDLHGAAGYNLEGTIGKPITD